jgi:fatty-acyl-CoA synthase
VVAAGEPPTLEDLAAHCDGRLARFKRPRRLVVVDGIPRTPATNQVQRRLLVEEIS